jgi:hypothetical protein
MHRQIEMKITALCALALSLSTVCVELAAQVCLGTPLNAGQNQGMLGVSSWSDYGTNYDINLGRMVSPELSLKAGYTLFQSESSPTIFGHRFSTEAAYEKTLKSRDSGTAISVCPVVGLNFGRIEAPWEVWIPFGAALGFGFPLGHGAVLNPYANPRVEWWKTTIDSPFYGQYTSTLFAWGFVGGVNLIIDRYVVGARISDAGDTFGVVGGMIF